MNAHMYVRAKLMGFTRNSVSVLCCVPVQGLYLLQLFYPACTYS